VEIQTRSTANDGTEFRQFYFFNTLVTAVVINIKNMANRRFELIELSPTLHKPL
jgi:hypothetical protein